MSKIKLLREYYALCPDGRCDITLLNEAERQMQNSGKTILTGIFQRADQENGNGRIYSKRILEREDRNYQKLIREKRALGELDHPDDSVVNLRNASHRVLRTFWKGPELWGTIHVLSTPSGQILEALINDGVMVGISSRGLGSVDESGSSIIVQEDFLLIAMDIVSDPSTAGAFMIKEARDNYLKKTGLITKSDRIYRLLNSILETRND